MRLAAPDILSSIASSPRTGRLRRRRELLSLVCEADANAGARVHAATSRLPYGPVPSVGGCVTMPAVILSSPSISDGTGSGFIVVVDRTPLRMAVAICIRRAAYAWSRSVMMPRGLIETAGCGGVVFQACTRVGHVPSDFAMLLTASQARKRILAH